VRFHPLAWLRARLEDELEYGEPLWPRARHGARWLFRRHRRAARRTSYDYNGLLGNLLAGETAPNPLPIAAISGVIRPSETVMFEDQALTWARSQPEPR